MLDVKACSLSDTDLVAVGVSGQSRAFENLTDPTAFGRGLLQEMIIIIISHIR